MDKATTTIELPRIEGESARAYSARREYVLMGPQRSIDKVAVNQKGIKSGSRSSTLLDWSRKYNWVESARQYDDTLVGIAVQEAAEQYQDDLKEFRIKYGKAGYDLYKVAQGMLALFARNLQGQKIEGKDGKVYIIPAVEMNANTLGQIKAAFQTAADLEALGLRVEHLLNNDQPRNE